MTVQKISEKQRQYLRKYAGQETAEPLVNRLNAGGPKAALFIELIDANAMHRAFAEPTTRAVSQKMLDVLKIPREVARKIQKFPDLDRAKPGYEGPFAKATAKIRAILSDLLLTPSFAGTVRGRWMTVWIGQGMRGSEAEAVFSLLELGSAGLLHRVIRCGNPSCNQWLYAAPPWRRFHSKECQQSVYESNPERLESRREWAKKNYLIEKQRGKR